MSNEHTDVLDVEARVVSNELDDSAAAAADGTTVLSLEKSLVPAFDAGKQIALANPAIEQLNALRAEIAAANVEKIDVATKDGEEKVRALLRRCVKLRTGTEKAYDAWNRPLLDAQRGIRKVVKDVCEGIAPDETKLEAIVKKIDEAREAERQRLIALEQARIEALRKKIDDIQACLVAAVSLTSAEIDTKVRELQDLIVNDDATSFGEFSDEAEALRGNVISKLLEMSKTKRQDEEQKAAVERQRQEQLERERAAEIERGLRVRIQALQSLAFSAIGKAANDIQSILDQLITKEPLALEFGDLAQEAAATWVGAKVALEHALAAQQRIEEQQAEQERVEREQAAERRRLQEAARAAAPAPTPAPTPVPTAAPVASLVSPLESAGMDDTSDFALAASGKPEPEIQVDPAFPAAHFGHDLIQTDSHAPPVGAAPAMLSMSQFLTREDYYEAIALRNLGDTWGDEYTEPSTIAQNILDSLALGDFPTEQSSELDLISLLLHEPVLAALRARRAALISAIAHEQVTA